MHTWGYPPQLGPLACHPVKAPLLNSWPVLGRPLEQDWAWQGSIVDGVLPEHLACSLTLLRHVPAVLWHPALHPVRARDLSKQGLPYRRLFPHLAVSEQLHLVCVGNEHKSGKAEGATVKAAGLLT